MRAAHQPETYGLVLGAREMDVLVELVRIFVRDFETDELVESMLAELEAVYDGERAGGRAIDMNYLLNAGEIVDQDDEDGGSAVEA